MSRYTLSLLTLVFLGSCSSWDWNKLDPLYVESHLDKHGKPIFQTLPDGRDISGYPIPGEKKSAEPSSSESEILVGTPGDKPGQVRSPYPPYKLLNSGGFASGTLVKDPETQKTFRLP